LFLGSYICLQKATKKQARLASGSTLTIEEWKAEQQLGGRERAHNSSCQTRGFRSGESESMNLRTAKCNE